jgi:hypothetical protein
MLFASNSPPWSQTSNFCFECHRGTGSVQEGVIINWDYSKTFGGASIDLTNIYDAFNADDPPNASSSHDLSALLNEAVTNHPEWGFTSNSNPCLLCHSPHTAEENYPVIVSDPLNTAIRRPSHYKSTNSEDFLWGDDENERMDAYAASFGGVYQPPYYAGGGFEPTGTATNYAGDRTPDYVTLCLDCHQDMENEYHSVDWANTAHGGSDGWNEIPPPPYTDNGKNYVLSCLDCHEPHGSTQNWTLIRRVINGEVVTSGFGACYQACHSYY